MEIDEEQDLEGSSINIDMQLAQTERPKASKKWSQTWQPLFHTNGFLKEHEELKLEDFALKDRQLRSYGS